jgi:hypothetical protein
MKAIIPLIASLVFTTQSYAEERVNLVLRAYVPPSITTKISQIQLSSSKSLVKFSSQINSKYFKESQKFEVEGLDQSGVSGKIELVAGSDRSISYELLVKHLNSSLSKDRPIFLKISAN